MPLKIYNTLTRQKEDFVPNNLARSRCTLRAQSLRSMPRRARVLVHRLRRGKRYFKFRGYTVRHVQNFTDIEDRII